MKIVLDTNALLQAISSRSEHFWIWQLLQNQQITLCITTNILLEYEEVLIRHRTPEIAKLICEILLSMPNLARVETYFSFGLPKKDFDDQKFVDCAIACGAAFLVTKDTDFKELKSLPFPIVKVVTPREFKSIWALK